MKLEEIKTKIPTELKPKADTLLSILTDMELSEPIECEGLLYFLMQNGAVELENIEADYKEAVNAVTILNKLDKLSFETSDENAEDIRKMFFAITKDIRIIMVKIALVVTDLRHQQDMEPQQRTNMAKAILSLFAPLSARLGMSTYKTELENGAFLIANPKKYLEIQVDVDKRFHKREPIVERLKLLTKKCMDELKIEGKVFGRKKHIYSIYKKLADHTMDQIYDLIAVRAIVNTVADCYALLGRLHSEVEPIPGRFKDYIAIPKPNGYQSLHTTVKFEGFPVEIQIRTQEMHKYAEYGIAAHWIYKEKRNKQDSLDIRLAWLRQMMENENVSIEELANSLNQDIYNNEIFVQTPKGKVIYLTAGSSPLDFAYAIHSEIGNRCVGAKVNDKMVPVTTPLNNGDVVEIITNPNSKGPSRDWLKICKTSEARKKINEFFKRNMKDENIKLGKTMLENAIKERGYTTNKLMTSSAMQEVVNSYNVADEDELLALVGTNAVKPNAIVNKLANIFQKQFELEQVKTVNNFTISLATPQENQVALKGLNNILMKFAGCCKPMYGDDIVGFVSTGRGVIIHRKVCPNVACFDESRLIDANWKPKEIDADKKKRKKKN